MLEDMALVSLPDAVNVGLCGKACLGNQKMWVPKILTLLFLRE